jgi:integrase
MLALKDAVQNHCLGKSPATKQIYKRIGLKFEQFCKLRGIAWNRAKYHDILAFLEFLKDQPGQPSTISDRYCNKTIRRALVLMAAIYRANRLDFSIFDPALRLVPVSLKPQKRFTGLVPFSQVQQLFSACPETKPGARNRAYMALCFGGALRTSEAISVKLGDLKKTNRETAFVQVFCSKTKSTAQQVIAPSLVGFVLDYKQIRLKEGASAEDYLLTSYDFRGQVPTNRKLARKRMLEIFWKLCQQVLNRKLGTHSMRATAITKLISDGVPHKRIQLFSRHSTVSMVELYDKSINDIEKNPGKSLNFSQDAN